MKELLAPTDPEVCSSSAATPGKVFAKTWTGAYLEDGFVRRLHSKASFPREGTSHWGTSTCTRDNLFPPLPTSPAAVDVRTASRGSLRKLCIRTITEEAMFSCNKQGQKIIPCNQPV